MEDQVAKWSQVIEAERIGKELPEAEAKNLFDAVCWECGKETKVVFEPDGKRPVYCRKCLKKIQEEKQRSSTSPTEERQPEVREEKRRDFKKEFSKKTISSDSAPTVSLEEAIKKGSEKFNAKKKRDRKKPDVSGLRDTLKDIK